MSLSLLVAGSVLPLLLFAVGLIYFDYVRDRADALDRVLDTVRGISQLVDTEAQRITTGLQVLAQSQGLTRDDFDSFRRSADAFASQYGAESSVLLGDRDGRQILNTRAPPGEALPSRQNLTNTEQVFRTGKPAYSRLFTGSVINSRIITVEVPVMRDGKVVYVISFNPPLSLFQRILEQRRPGPDWTLSIFDQDATNFARIPNPEQTIGQHASAGLASELSRANEAKITTVSREGVSLLTAFTHSPVTGWIVAAGIASESLTAPLYRYVGITTAAALILLAIGLSFAIRMATRIAHAEALHGLLVEELNHRVKNTLAMTQSLATQSFKPGAEMKEAIGKFEARLTAFGRAHNVLNQQKWESADIRDIVEDLLEPFGADAGRVRATGPAIRLSPSRALMMSMVLHELATNAVKYGALSNAGGNVAIEWTTDEAGALHLTWRESGGPAVRTPSQKGFGSRLLEQSFGRNSDRAEIEFKESGIVCTIVCADPS